MKARSRRGGFDVTAIRMPAAFSLGAVKYSAGMVVVNGPRGGKKVYAEEDFHKLYTVTEPDASSEQEQ